MIARNHMAGRRLTCALRYVAMDRYRGIVAVVIVAAVCAVPAVGLAAAAGKLTRSELNAKSNAGNKLYAAINAAMTYESGVLANLCTGAKSSGGANVRSALTRVARNLERNLDKLKSNAKNLQKWADGLDARADRYGDAKEKQLVKEASGSLLVGFADYEDAIDALKSDAAQIGQLACNHSYRKPVNSLADGTDAATKGFEKLFQVLHLGF